MKSYKVIISRLRFKGRNTLIWFRFWRNLLMI